MKSRSCLLRSKTWGFQHGEHYSAEHLASPKPGTNKNWFGPSHFVTIVIDRARVRKWGILVVRLAYWELNVIFTSLQN